MIEYSYENFSKINDTFQDIFDYGYRDVAKQVYNSLNVLLTIEKEKQEPTLFKKFKKLQAKYGFVCLSALAEKDLMDLLKNHLAVVFEISGYNLWEEIKKYLVTLVLYEERDRVKNDIKNILIKSETKITATNLILDKKEIGGTISNWIRDYHSYLGAGIIDQFQFEQYFINSININKLTPAEKERVKSIFKLYDKLKISSMTPQGYEERVLMKINGELRVWKDGFLEDFDPAVVKAVKDLKARGFFQEKGKEQAPVISQSNKVGVEGAMDDLAELKQLVSQYPAGSLEHKAVIEEIEKLQKKIG